MGNTFLSSIISAVFSIVCLAGAISNSGEVHARQEVLAVTGDVAAGAANLRLAQAAPPALNDSGEIVVRTTLQHGFGGVTEANDSAVWKIGGGVHTIVARESIGLAPGGGAFSAFQAASIDDAGDIAVRATLADASTGLWRFDSLGVGSAASRSGGAPPGVPAAQFEAVGIPLLHASSGVIAYDGRMVEGIGDVTNLDSRGIWLDSAAGGALVARSRETPAPGVEAATFGAVGVAAVNALGQVAALGSFHDNPHVSFENRRALWRLEPAGGIMVARNGSLGVPGVTGASFETFDEPSINSTGAVAYSATLMQQGAVNGTNNRGVWLRDDAGGHQLLLRSGAGGVPGVPLASLSEVGPLLLNDAGQVLVKGALTAGIGGVTAETSVGLWIVQPGQGALVKRIGSGGVPGIAGASFTDFGELAFNEQGVVAVGGSLAIGAGGVNESNDRGLWLLDSAGGGQLVARTGDVVGGRTIAALEFLGGSGGADGRQRSLNRHGQLAYRAAFTSGDEGVLLYTPDLTWRGGTAGAWDDSQNWTLGLAPAQVHAVEISPSAAATISVPTGNHAVRTLKLGAGSGAATLALATGSTFTAIEGAEIGSNGRLSGQAVVDGSLLNRGIVQPGTTTGPMIVTGDYLEENGGVLSIEIGGTSNDPLNRQFDQLFIGGHAELGGTLQVSLVGGFVPSPGDSFSILAAAGGITPFGSIELPVLPADRSWQTITTSNALTLTVAAAGSQSADFDGDGDIDGGDLTRWRSNFGLRPAAAQSQGDADADGDVDGADFLAWQRQLAGGPATAVPEPAALLTAALLCGLLAVRLRHCLGGRYALV